MIRRITDKILKDVEFDIAREPDPQGHQIERDPDFSIFYRDTGAGYNETHDLQFNPRKKYLFKNNNIGRTVTATPHALNLYTYNGINYIPCRYKRYDKDEEIFKDNVTYYYQNEDGNFIEANPRNQKLLEKVSGKYKYYYVYFYTHDDNIKIPLFHFDSENFEESELFSGAKEAFDWCKQNREDIKEIYEAAKENGESKSSIRKILQDFLEGVSDYRQKRKNQNYTTRVATAKDVTERIRKIRTETPYGNPVYVASVLDDYHLTQNQIDPASDQYKVPTREEDIQNPSAFENRVLKAQQKAYGFAIYHSGGKYKINKRRTPNTFLGQHILNSYEQTKWQEDETLDGLVKKVNALSKILQDFKDEQYPEEELHEYLRTISPSSIFDSAPTELTDSIVKDEKLVPVYESFGVYKDEQSGKYVVNVKTPDGKLIRLGNFDKSMPALRASQEFAKTNYDVNAFIESDFYKKNIESFKEFYKMYIEGAKKETSEELSLKIEKNEEGTYDILYKTETGEFEKIKNFRNESSAKDFVQKAEGSGDVEKFIENFKGASGTVIKGLNTIGITKGVHNTKSFTYADKKRIGEILSPIFTAVDAETAEEVLRGPREEHGKLYLKVEDFAKEKLLEEGFDEEKVESLSLEDTEQYQLLLSLQEILMRTVIRKLMQEAIQHITDDSIEHGILYSEEDFEEHVVNYIKRNMTFIRPTYDKNNESLRKSIRPKYFFYKTKVRRAL